MKRIVSNIIMALTLLFLPAVACGQVAYAATPTTCGKSPASQQVFNGINQTTPNSSPNPCNDTGITNIISVVITILSLVVGAAAIIVILVSGFKYITSNGDSAKVGNAKNTLIYALIGLVIAALAQFLVHFVLYNADTATHPCKTNSSISDTDPSCKA